MDSKVPGARLKISLFSEDAPGLITLPADHVWIENGQDFAEFEVTATPPPGLFMPATVTVYASFFETTVVPWTLFKFRTV